MTTIKTVEFKFKGDTLKFKVLNSHVWLVTEGFSAPLVMQYDQEGGRYARVISKKGDGHVICIYEDGSVVV